MKYVIVGNSDYAHMLYGYMIEREEDEIVAFSVEKAFIDSAELHGKKVVAYEEIEKCFSPEDVQLLLAVGYSGMNDVKEKLFYLYKEKGYRFGTYIHPSAIIGKDVVLGEGNIIFEGTIIQNGCMIGDANSFFVRTTIAHDCVIGNFNSFACASYAARRSKITRSFSCSSVSFLFAKPYAIFA